VKIGDNTQLRKRMSCSTHDTFLTINETRQQANKYYRPISFPPRGGGGGAGDSGDFIIINIFSEPGLVRLFAMGVLIFVAFVLENEGPNGGPNRGWGSQMVDQYNSKHRRLGTLRLNI
jgi:hypothetical protein